LVDYDLLTKGPAKTMSLIYQFLGEEPFEHDFQNVEYQEPEFDNKLKTKGLHQVRSQVEFKPRKTILPPDLFERFDSLSFWTEATNSRASMIVAKAKETVKNDPP
jgi:sulfotransferase